MKTKKLKATGKNLGSVHYGVPPEVWVRRCRGVALGFARSHSGSMAELVAAEAIAKIWRQQQQGKEPVGFKPDGVPCNLFKTTRTVFYDSLRRESLHGTVIDPDKAVKCRLLKKTPKTFERLDALARVYPPASLGCSGEAVKILQYGEVQAVLDGDVLPDVIKRVVMDHFLEGMSYATLAEKHGVDRRTVKCYVEKGLHLIRQELGVVIND